jgi:cytochrome b561
MEGFKPQLRGVIVPLHISSGLTALMLTGFRVAWRLAHPPPPFSNELKPWECSTAHTAHGLIYVLMALMPLTGWSIISAHQPRSGGGPRFWGLVGVPPIPPIAHLEVNAQKAAHAAFVNLHSIDAWILVGLLLLHVGAALKHQFRDRQPELDWMGLGLLRR